MDIIKDLTVFKMNHDSMQIKNKEITEKNEKLNKDINVLNTKIKSYELEIIDLKANIKSNIQINNNENLSSTNNLNNLVRNSLKSETLSSPTKSLIDSNNTNTIKNKENDLSNSNSKNLPNNNSGKRSSSVINVNSKTSKSPKKTSSAEKVLSKSNEKNSNLELKNEEEKIQQNTEIGFKVIMEEVHKSRLTFDLDKNM